MTGEEEAVLKEYLLHDGEIEDDEDFEAWYMQRYENADSEDHYKNMLNLAQAWKRRYEEGFLAGVAYQLCQSLSPAKVSAVEPQPHTRC